MSDLIMLCHLYAQTVTRTINIPWKNGVVTIIIVLKKTFHAGCYSAEDLSRLAYEQASALPWPPPLL